MLAYPIFNDKSFNDTLPNDIVSFEQPGPGYQSYLELYGNFTVSIDCR